MNLLFFLWD